ncbi:hypothetical protein COCMIDRAFT_689 [Bipolaris oryzae ATCC 44560]|uniref:F-box domain-containing protein n=1 Tax=Bipolaris oryzae ATCC 44560 TaxID=930090 RepID=W7A3D7_COCMI|nr:uncharacterized protein COCMIDRAFT_689 [Bipolaris oryzae ATCC 44560]EUC50531.1 hypothetical protein COCMIDRAFT_689 [Bipolaris oryzae ATCC 44560]
MFSNLQIRPAKPERRKPNLTIRAGVSKRRVSYVSALSASRVPSLSFMEGLFGDEFPEAFGSGEGPSAKSRKTILDLPAELLDLVCAHISKPDIKHLRLASKQLANSVYLRIDRVYVSPNRANIDYLYQILSHPRYKYRVHEIIWDDTRLEEYSSLGSFRDAILFDEREFTRSIESRLEEAIWIYGDDNPEYHALEHDDLFESNGRLTEAAKEILLRYDDQFSREVLARNATMMDIEDSYSLYQDLYREEQAIMDQEADINALEQALMGFTMLKRVTFTTEIWRSCTFPHPYNTPFHRSLPVGFRKPQIRHMCRAPVRASEVHDSPMKTTVRSSQLSTNSGGYSSLVSAILNMPNPGIEEFVVETENEAMIPHKDQFTLNRRDLDNTRSMFRKIALKYLKFPLTSEEDTRADSTPHNIYSPQNFLAELRHLEHLDLNLSCNTIAPMFGRVPRFIPIPENLRRQLKTLTLRHVAAEDDDLFGLFTSMPNLQHVTLYRLYQGNEQSSWALLFQHLKTCYSTAVHASKPRFVISQSLDPDTTNLQVVDQEVDDYLYGNGEHPFMEAGVQTLARLKQHMGWRVDPRDDTVRERMSDFCARTEMQEWDCST